MSSVCVVTGISAGIGKAAAVALARRGVQVVGVVRDAGRGRAAVKEIRDRAPAAEVDLLVADLSALDEVRQLAEQIRTRYDHLGVLLHNAGVALYRRETTVDGYERMFATNHLAPYLLTRLLIDRLEAAGTKPARVISVSSQAHRQVRRIPWDDLKSERSYSALRAYNLSKLANVLFVRALAERLDQRAVVANAVSPGFVRTELNRGATLPFGSSSPWCDRCSATRRRARTHRSGRPPPPKLPPSPAPTSRSVGQPKPTRWPPTGPPPNACGPPAPNCAA